MSLLFTRLRLFTIPRRARLWLRFGFPAEQTRPHRGERFLYFVQHSNFCTLRWHGNDYGTILWQLSILRSVAPWQRASVVMDIDPGADVLLRVSSRGNIHRVLELIKSMEDRGIAPETVACEYWRTLQNRLMSREILPVYGPAQHAAFLAFHRIMG